MSTRTGSPWQRRLAAAGTAAALVGGLVLTGGSAEANPESADVRAQAATLATQVEDLQTEVAVAAERYNALSTRLSGIVTESIQASERLDALTGLSSERQGDMSRRVSAIYRSGGGLSLYATVLDGGSPADLLDRLHTVQSLVVDDLDEVRDLEAEVRGANATKARMVALARERTELSAKAEDARDRVTSLLSERQAALDEANETVVRLAEDEQARRRAVAESAAAVTLADVGVLMGDAEPGNPFAATAIAAARSKLGVPYVWGGTGPNGYDCSGLLQWAYGQAGLPIMRVASDQYRSGPVVPLDRIAPGDFVFWASDPTRPYTIHHMAMYVGNGMMIEAPHTGALVRLVPLRLGSEFLGPVRPGLSAAGAPSA